LFTIISGQIGSQLIEADNQQMAKLAVAATTYKKSWNYAEKT